MSFYTGDFVGIGRRNQDEPCNGSMPGQIGGDCGADAEADRNHILARRRLLQAVEDHK